MRRRTMMLLPLTTVLLGTAVFFVWNALPVHSTEKPPVHSQAAATPKPKTSVTPSPSPTPTPTPVATPTARTTTTSVTTAAAVAGNSLSIPSIGVNASIVDVGLDSQRRIAAPANSSQVGRWISGGWPGGLGSAVFLTGHVQGVFSKLKNVTIGQTLSVNYNSQVFNYRVVHKETVNLSGINMSKPLSIYGGGQEGLNIMTCAGSYQWWTGTYSQRLTVYTVRIP